MDDPKWRVNYIGVSDFGTRKEIGTEDAFCVMGAGFGQNSVFAGLEIDLLQYDADGETRRVNLKDLSGTFARMGQHTDKMKFHLDWPSCLKVMKACQEAGIVPMTDGKLIWIEINNVFDVLIKSQPR